VRWVVARTELWELRSAAVCDYHHFGGFFFMVSFFYQSLGYSRTISVPESFSYHEIGVYFELLRSETRICSEEDVLNKILSLFPYYDIAKSLFDKILPHLEPIFLYHKEICNYNYYINTGDNKIKPYPEASIGYGQVLVIQDQIKLSKDHLYVATNNTGHYKIGRTKNLVSRLYTLNISAHHKIEYLFIKKNFGGLEKHFHKLFEEKRTKFLVLPIL